MVILNPDTVRKDITQSLKDLHMVWMHACMHARTHTHIHTHTQINLYSPLYRGISNGIILSDIKCMLTKSLVTKELYSNQVMCINTVTLCKTPLIFIQQPYQHSTLHIMLPGHAHACVCACVRACVYPSSSTCHLVMVPCNNNEAK